MVGKPIIVNSEHIQIIFGLPETTEMLSLNDEQLEETRQLFGQILATASDLVSCAMVEPRLAPLLARVQKAQAEMLTEELNELKEKDALRAGNSD